METPSTTLGFFATLKAPTLPEQESAKSNTPLSNSFLRKAK
jgi:hypothetical protein